MMTDADTGTAEPPEGTLTRSWEFRFTAERGTWPDMPTHAGSRQVITPDLFCVAVRATGNDAPRVDTWAAGGVLAGHPGQRDRACHYYIRDEVPGWITGLLRQCVATALADLPGYLPPLEMVLAYVSAAGWTQTAGGISGSAWQPPEGPEVYMPPGDSDQRFLGGAVERIADREKRSVPEVVADILALKEAAPDGN